MNGTRIIRIGSFNSRYIFTFSALLQALRLGKKHDLIQTTTFNGAFPAWIAGKINKKPVVLTVHEVWAGKWKEVTEFSRIKATIHDLLERMIFLLPFDRYVCVSQATKMDLVKRGIKEEKIKVVYNGIDYSFWNRNHVTKKEIEEVREKLSLPGKIIYFSWGRPGTSKGFEYAIKAASLAAEKNPNFILMLMLGSPHRYKQKYHELLSLITKANQNDIIKVIPSVSYPELRTLLAAIDYVIIPSVAEGFGYAAAEAAALDKPMIVSDAGSLPEVVSGKHLIFSSKNVADLAEKMVKMSKGEYQETEKKQFKWDETMAGYLQVYHQLYKITNGQK